MTHKNIQGNASSASRRRWLLQSAAASASALGQAASAASLLGAFAAEAAAQTQRMSGIHLAASRSKSVKPSQAAVLPQAPKPEKRSFTVATTNLFGLPYLPLLVAQKRGYFAIHGLDLEIVEHQSVSRAMQALGAGQADAVCAWLENTLSPAGRALLLQSYVLMGRAPMMALGAAARPAAKIQTLAQLRGRMLGVVALNSPTHTMALAVLRSAIVCVGMVSVGSPASAMAALRSGQIDALMHLDPLMTQLEQRGEIEILADLRSPESTSQRLDAQLPSSCLATTSDVLQRMPGAAQASADAMYQSQQWLRQASLRDVLHLLPDGLAGIDTQLFLASFSRLRQAYSADGLCSPQELANVWQAMLEAEPTLRLEKVNLARASSNDWMLRSAARLQSQPVF
jgi:NitT/TauT family transport system substrate-binding protein